MVRGRPSAAREADAARHRRLEPLRGRRVAAVAPQRSLNGWGNFPNPAGYTDRKMHAYFEGVFVRQNLKRDAVAVLVPADSSTPLPRNNLTILVQVTTQELLRLSLAQVVPLYELEKQGGFKAGDQRGIEFATAGRDRRGVHPRHDR